MQTHESKIDTGKKPWNADMITDSIYDEDANAGGRVDQYTEQCQVKSPMLDSSPNKPEQRHMGQIILKQTSNKAKIEKEIDVLETMNIELEHSVATICKENETLKQHYKDLYDFIKITRSKTTEQTTSLLASNTELKAQIQEKVFAIVALKMT
ncbi:hypothetical protein Tco_1438741 [Tanacetum coccineum]